MFVILIRYIVDSCQIQSYLTKYIPVKFRKALTIYRIYMLIMWSLDVTEG